MKLKLLNQLLHTFAVASLVISHAQTVRAVDVTDDNTLTVALTMIYQGAETVSDTSPVTVDTVGKVRWTTKTILRALADATGNAAVTNSGNYIDVKGDGSVVVKDRTGTNDVQDVSSNLTVTWGSDSIFSGKSNGDTMADAETQYTTLTLHFADAQSNSADVSGVATVSYSATAQNADTGAQKFKDNARANVAGTGQAGGDAGGATAVVTGTVSMKGSGSNQ